MKKTIITTLVGIIGLLSFCMICSEPTEGTPMRSWLLWEAVWMAVLFVDVKVFNILDKKGWIKD